MFGLSSTPRTQFDFYIWLFFIILEFLLAVMHLDFELMIKELLFIKQTKILFLFFRLDMKHTCILSLKSYKINIFNDILFLTTEN